MTEGTSSGTNGAPAKTVTSAGASNMFQQLSSVLNQSQAHSQSNGVYLNPHAAAQAAAAFTAAAQQIVQSQMQQQQQQPLTNDVVTQQVNHSFTPQAKPNGQQAAFTISRSLSNPVAAPSTLQLGAQPQQNASIQGPVESSNITPTSTFAQTSLAQGQNANVTSNSTQAPTPTTNTQTTPATNALLNPQHLALSAQAQAAAILAAGSFNPSLMLNTHSHNHTAPNPNPSALTAAQVVASLLQHQTQAVPSQNVPSSQNSIQAQATTVPATAPANLNHAPNNTAAITTLKPQLPDTNTNFSAFNMAVPEPACSIPRGNTDTPVSSAPSATTNPGLFVAAAAAANNPVLLAQMRNWKLDQLEAHVKLIQDANQPIPQPISLLLAEARRREEKRTAKRVANRKSACTSRARKKALVEEMTRTNAKLRRQALILALLPDMVIAIQVNGDITFCSAQVERVLKHSVEDLVGSNISQILIPSSRESLSLLIEKMVLAEQMALEESKDTNDGSGGSSNSGNDSGAAVVSLQSEQGFPMSVVKVRSHPEVIASDSSGGENGAQKQTSAEASKSALSSLGSGNSDGPSSKPSSSKSPGSSGDDSSSCSDAKNLQKASEALNRNVRWHNAQLLSKKVNATKSSLNHKDDVTGASVTANNADARLSSLQHNPKRQNKGSSTNATGKKSSSTTFEHIEDNSFSSSTDSLLAGVEEKRSKVSQGRSSANENSSEDSGYRESREDTALSESETSNTSNGRPSRLIPTCNVCLIKDDLSTIWCEVTSSIRTRSLGAESNSWATSGDRALNSKKDNREKKDTQNSSDDVNSSGQIKELLLCLRPIREGKEPVGEDLRFVPKRCLAGSKESTSVSNQVKDSPGDKPTINIETVERTLTSVSNKTRPMKKRPLPTTMSSPSNGDQNCVKKHTVDKSNIDAEKSVVESLMLMSSHNKK